MKNLICKAILIITLIAISQITTAYQLLRTEDYTVKSTILIKELKYPWSIVEIEEEKFLISEKVGEIILFDNVSKKISKIKNVPQVTKRGQGGLLALGVDPNFSQTKQIYISYTKVEKSKLNLEIVSAKLNGLELSDIKLLYQVSESGSLNIGSRFLFDKKGKLLFSVGDRFKAESSQNLRSPLGKIIRINKDGSIPGDNPTNIKGLREIYTYGNRNIQGMVYDKERDIIWAAEHGPAGGDEINIIEPGKNYGWAKVSYGRNYDGTLVNKGATRAKGITDPIYYWTPSIAPSGMSIYYGDEFPSWKGNLLVASLKYAYLSRITLNAENKFIKEERMFPLEWGRIRDVIVAKSGKIYLITDNENGYLIELSFAK